MGLWLKREGPYGLKTKKKRVLCDLRLKIKKNGLMGPKAKNKEKGLMS